MIRFGLTSDEVSELQDLLDRIVSHETPTPSLSTLVERWNHVVSSVEMGYKDSIYEYTNELRAVVDSHNLLTWRAVVCEVNWRTSSGHTIVDSMMRASQPRGPLASMLKMLTAGRGRGFQNNYAVSSPRTSNREDSAAKAGRANRPAEPGFRPASRRPEREG